MLTGGMGRTVAVKDPSGDYQGQNTGHRGDADDDAQEHDQDRLDHRGQARQRGLDLVHLFFEFVGHFVAILTHEHEAETENDLAITLGGDQVVSGMGIWILGLGLTTYIGSPYTGPLGMERIPTIFGLSPFFYVGIILAVITWYVLFKTSLEAWIGADRGRNPGSWKTHGHCGLAHHGLERRAPLSELSSGFEPGRLV